MQFEAAEEHLRAALASGATLTTRAAAASWLGRCAIVSGGRSARARPTRWRRWPGSFGWPTRSDRSSWALSC